MIKWVPGDRVKVLLPEGRHRLWVAGVVRRINEPGLRPGVRVDLDRPVNGASDCYATHAELRRAE